MARILCFFVALFIGINYGYSFELWDCITSEMTETECSKVLLEKYNAKLVMKYNDKNETFERYTDRGNVKRTHKATSSYIYSHDNKGHPEYMDFSSFFLKQESFRESYDNLYESFCSNLICYFYKDTVYGIQIILDASFYDVRNQLIQKYGKGTKIDKEHFCWETEYSLIYCFQIEADNKKCSEVVYINKEVRNDWIDDCERKRIAKIEQEKRQEKEEAEALNFLSFDKSSKTLFKYFCVNMTPNDCIEILNQNFNIDKDFIVKENVELYFNPEEDGCDNPLLTMYAFRVYNDSIFFNDFTFFDEFGFYQKHNGPDYTGTKGNLFLYFYDNKLYAVSIVIASKLEYKFRDGCPPASKTVEPYAERKKGANVYYPVYYFKLKTKDIYWDPSGKSIVYVDSVARKKYVDDVLSKKKENAKKIKL